MSGKGGVGKSSVAAYLSVALAGRGFNVGLMDVDLHGPSIPRLLGLKAGISPSENPGKAVPVPWGENLRVISIESLMGEDKDLATIWRGPLKIGVIRQFIADIEWPDLDYLIIDSPPGTGDEPLTVAQTIPDAQALIVTTPQEISLADVRKSISFCRQVQMNILGLVENMSGLSCPHCGERIDLFSTHGGETVAHGANLKLLASLPIEPEVVRQGDQGRLDFLRDQAMPFSREFSKMVDAILDVTPAEIALPKREEMTEEYDMEKLIFAIPVSQGKLCSHFGHCEQFALIQAEQGEIKGKSMHTPPPHEPGVLPKWLHELGANVVITGGMGARALDLFQQNNIKVITGAPMDPPEALVRQYLSDTLVTGDNVCDH
jgi:Mrp family chromosome partitioning ATPase/predicted Fe-Mo cluster-binding NifX family protein